MTLAVSLEQPQYVKALAMANKARFGHSRIKRDVKAGRLAITDALADPDAATLTVFDLLKAQRRWGPIRTVKFLAQIPISEKRLVRDLTERQKTLLAEACAR